MPGLTDLLRNPRRLRQFAETPGNYPAALEYATQDQAQGRVGRRPASRASSSTKEPGKLDTGEYIDQVELPDGSVVRPATESGKLVKAPGKSNLYLDPATGEPYHADPSQATGLRSAWNTARQVKRDGKVYATISGVGEREIGADPKAAEDAAKAEAKRAAENRRLELAREKRPYNIDRVTGEPVPLQTDEQWAAIKQAKAAKLDESARVKRLKDQADVIDLEADRVTLNAPKPAKEDEEAFNAAEAALMPHAAGQDLEQVAKKYATEPATDETSQQAKSAAENYLAYKDKVKPARDAEKKVKELKLRAIDIKEQIINPQKWKEGKTASIAGLPDDDLVAEAKAQADIITEQEGQAVGTLDQITQGRNKIVKDLNDFTAARQRQASVGLSVEEQQAADHTQAQMEQSLAEYDDWHSEAKAEADASLKAAADRRDVLKVASTEIEARTAKQKESAVASKAKMEVMVKAKPLYKDWAGGASGLYVEDWRTEEETPRFKQEAAKAGLSMPEAKEALQTYRQLDWSNGRRDPKTANEIHEDARLLPNGEITVNPMHLLDPEAYDAAADATQTTPEAKARAKAMRAELAVPVAEEAYKNLRKNSDFAAWLDANTTGTPLQRMEKFNAEMKSGGALNASLMKFLGSAASLPSGWLGTIAGLTGSDKALEYARYWQDRSQAYGTAAGEAGKGTNMAGRFMASVAGGVPSVMESMAVGGVAGRLIGSGVAALGVAAVDAAAQSGGGTFVDAVDAYIAQGLSPEEAKAKAVAPALASGLATGVLTAIGGGGVESLLRREGQELAKAAIKRGLKTMVAREVIEGVGEEALEEFSDQLLQGIIAQASYDPTKSLDQIMSEAIEAGLVGGVLGGGASGIRAYAEGKDANQTGAVPPTPGSPAPMPVQPRPAGPAPTPTPQVPQTPQDVADQVAKFNPTGATPLPQSVAATAKRTGRTPEAVARQAASGVVKLAQGQSIESLDIEEQEALGFVNKNGKIVAADNKVTPLVYDYKGKPIIRNAAAEWLTDEAQEGLAGMVNLTEAERKAQIDAEEAAAKAKPAAAPAKKARPADIEDWDWTEKGKVRRRATEEWFEEGMANADVNAAFERAHAVGADALASHGMAKFGTLSGAYDALMGLLTKGVDPKRGRGTLDVAPLTVAKGSAESQGGQTAGGTSYRDGPFILLSRKQSSISNSADIHAILVNDANAGQLEAIRREVHKLRPDIIVDLYSKADVVTQQLNQPAKKKAGQAAPAKAKSTPQVSGAVTTGGSLPSAAGSSPAPASTPQGGPVVTNAKPGSSASSVPAPADGNNQSPANEPKSQNTVSQEPPVRQDVPKPRDVSVLPEQPATPAQQTPTGPAPAAGGPKPKHDIGKGSVIFSDVYRSEGDVTLTGAPEWDASQQEWMYPAVTKGGRAFRVAERFVSKVLLRVTERPVSNAISTPTNDEEIVAESIESIINRTTPGQEREQAFAKRREAAVRIVATLKKGDKVIEDGGEGEEFIIDGTPSNGKAFVEGGGEPIDIAIMVAHQTATGANGSKVQIKPAKIVRKGTEAKATPAPASTASQPAAEEPALTPAQADQMARAQADHEKRKATIAKMENDPEMRAKKLYAEGMRFAAIKRQITGKLTGKEAEAKAKREASNYEGKPVSVDGKNATVVGTAFGKVKVKFADGTTASVPADKIKSPIKATAKEPAQASQKEASQPAPAAKPPEQMTPMTVNVIGGGTVEVQIPQKWDAELGQYVLSPEADEIINEAKWPKSFSSPFHPDYATRDMDSYFGTWGIQGDEQNRTQAQKNYRELLELAVQARKPVSKEGWKFDLRNPIPEGYVAEGELYVYRPAPSPAPASQAGRQATVFKVGDFVRANGKGPVFKVESIGEDGWVYLANGQGSYSAEDAANILVHSTEDAAKNEAVKGGWPWADKGEVQPPPAPSTPQRRMETALNEYEFSVRQTLVGTPTKATKDLAARKLDLAKRLRARLKAMTGAVEYDVYAKELREGRGELEVKPVGEKDSILFVNPEKLIDRLTGKHKTTEAAREALDAFILHEFIHKAAIANMDSAKIIGLYNLLTPAAKAASKALYLSDSGLTDFWHKSAAANEFAAAHEWFAQLIEARLRGKISNQAEIEASKDPAFRDKLMALLKDFVAQLRDIAKLVTDKTQAARIEAEADAVQAIVADMAAKAGLELGQQAKPPSQAAVAPEVAPEAALPQRDAVDEELAKAFDGLSAPPPTQQVEQVALPKERREAMLKAAGNIVDLGLTEPTDLAARLDKLAPNGSLRKYARSFWRLMTGFNADLQESPDWQAVFDSIDKASVPAKTNQSLVQAVPQKLPPPTAKDLFDREKYPGRQYAAPPNTVTFQLRGLNTYPMAFPLQAVPASSLEEASKIIKDKFIDLIAEFDGSMRESSFAYIGPDGVATHLGEFMFDRPMQWRPYSLSEDPFNRTSPTPNVTPPQAAAIAKEEAMPEPAKQAAPFDPVAAKGQKKYLLTEVAAAVKAAPRRSEMPEDVRDALNEIDAITAKFANQERRPLTADESAELSSQVKKLSAKVREAVGTITIEVPGDGTFTILNEKGALALFQKRADKFPTTQSKDDMPAKSTAQTPTAVPSIKKPKTTADMVAAIYPMVSTDTTRDTLTTVKGDGTNLWATNGRILVRVEQENGGGKGADNVSYDEKGNAQPWPVEKGNYNGEAIIPDDRKAPVHTIDTGRWFSIMSQARAVIKVLPSDKSESNYTKLVSIYQNPDGSLGAFTSDAERGDYVHNIQPNAKFLASYDPEYVQTILRVARNLGNEQIELRIADDISPATLRTSNATFVIMPMRVNGAAAYSPKAQAARPTPPVTTQPTPAPKPEPAPEPAPTKLAQTPAAASPAKEGIDDFGEKLGGARKDKVATVNQTLTDDEIAGKTLSEIWPKSEIASIEDDELAAYATTLRSIIPSKPQKGYKLNAWVGKVKMVKQLMRFAEDKGVPEMLAMMRGPEYNLGVLADRVAFLQGLPREHWDRVGEVRNYPNAYRFGEGADSSKKIPAPYADANVDGYRVRADNLDDLMEAVKAKLAKGKPVAKMEFEVRGKTGAWGINKKGDPHYRKLKTFADSKEALAYRDSNYDNLVKAWEDVKERDNVKETDLRTDTNRPRSAEDWRKGKDATSQMFNDAFGFRGVEFGNWVSQGKNAAERQGMMNDAYDALHDLASILNIPTKALSLNGQIGLGFGSRGQGWASAHYEPGSLVINLTKTRGAGTLAHELFHAFDHYFGRARGVSIKDRAGVYITNEPATRYVNQKTGQALSVKRWNEIKKGFSSSINEADWKLQEGVRPEVEDAFEAVVKALDASPMAQRARMNDKGQRDYWGSTIERAARAFENYVIHKMQQKGYQNDYLANVVRIEDFVRNPNRYPYLLDNEIEPVAKVFDDLFSTIKSRETDKGVELYAPPSQASVGQAVNEAFVKKIQDSVEAGRPVGTSNPTTASKTGEGTDSGHNVELDRLRKNNPLAYRQNALILTRYPVVAKKYRALHAALAKADAPVIAAKEEVKKAKAALAAAQKGIKDRVALLRGMKTAQVRASLVNEFIAANLTARAVKAKDVAHANLAKANAKAAKAADYQSKAISEILDGNAIPEDVAFQIYEDYITAVQSNLLALIELFPKRLRDVAKLWYDGANIIAQKFGKQYNATLEQASAVLAVFSPQKDWFMNVSLAQRMMNIWANDQETVWSPEMTKQFIMRSGEPQPVESVKKGDSEPTISTRESLITDANPEGIVYQHGAIKKVDDDGNTYWENWDNQKAAENLKAAQLMLKDLEGKTLRQIKDRKLKARFIRILSEVRDSSAYPIVTPDGRTGNMQVNNDKVTLSKVAWGGYNTIEKAISIMERSVTIKGRIITDEHEVISIALGDQHKVRSFYNNIVDPANKSGHVTMDTHAIAAIHWMPHSGSSLEVTQNFGGGGVKNDGIAGIKGTYAANAEAYRRAAVVFDLLPREVQSITWEAVRLLFPKEFKTKGNIDKVRAIWNRYFHGDIDIETARAEIFTLATTSKDFPQGKDIAGSVKDGEGLGDTAWAAAMGVGIDHSGGPEGTDDSGTVPKRGGPRGPNPRGSGGQSGGDGGGRNPAAMVRPTAILRRGRVGKPSLSLPPGQASPETAAWKTVDGRTWLTEAEARGTGLMYYNIEPDESGLNDQVTEEERRMLQRGKVLDIEAESVPLGRSILRAPLSDSEADALNLFDADAEESPAKVASSTSVHALRSHPDFNSAKFHGGIRQALNLVEDFLKPAAIEEVRQAVGGYTDKLVFVPVLSREGDSMNMIPLALANELNRNIGGKVWTKLVKVSSAHNTDASNIDRAHTVHNWSGELPPEGSTIVLVDDTFTTGQTLQSLGDMFKKVAAVTTLAAGRYGKNFRPTKDQVAAAMEKANLSHSEYLKYRPTGAAVQSYLLNGKPGRSGWDERFTGEGSRGRSTADGGDAKIPSLLSFFSGGGLLEVGLRGLVRGFGAVEFDANIAEVYAQNHGEHIDAADIRTIDFNKFKGAEYFHASPVCKQFSGVNTHASKGENDADVTTAEATAKALKIIRPAVFTLENVKAYEGSSSLKIITDTLDDLGYTWDQGVYDAADYGAPTHRKRFLIRAVAKGGLPPAPKPTHGPKAGKPYKSWWSAVEDLVDELPSSPVPLKAKDGEGDSYIVKRMALMGVDLLSTKEPVFLAGGSASANNLPFSYSNEPAPVIKATNAEVNRILLPDGRQLRATPRVLARVTGLPDSYKLPESQELAVKVIGNGIPPALTRAVFGPLTALASRENPRLSLGGDDPVASAKAEAIKFLADKNPAFLRELESDTDAFPHGAYMLEVPLDQLRPGNAAFDEKTIASIPDMSAPIMVDASALFSTDKKSAGLVVSDGNHRLEKAKRRGDATIRAIVTPWDDAGMELVRSLAESERVDSTSQAILRAPPNAGVPTQITRDMRQQLLDRGYTKKQIHKMKPAEAHAILNPPVEPASPEPEEAGQTDADMEAFMAEQQAIAEEEAAAREDLRNDPDAIDAVQASGKMSGRNLSKQFEYPEARAVYQALAAARDQLGGPETVQLDKLREWAKQTFESDPEKYIQWASDMAEENKLLDVDEQAVLGQAFQFLTREARLTGDKNIRALLNKVGNYYLDTGTRLAQAMSARRDPLETPHERWTKALDIVFGPSESVRRQLRVLPTESGKARRIARLEEELAEARGSRRADVEAALKTARAQQTKEELLEQDDVKSEKIKQAVLSKLDVTEDDLMLAGTDRVALHSAILDLPAVKAGLDAYKGKDNDGYNIMRLAFRGFSDAHIANALNLNQDDVGQFINDATNAIIRPAVAEQVKAGTGFGGLIKAGLAKFKKSVGLEAPPKTRPLQDWLTLIQGKKQTLNQVTTEVNRVMKYALQSAKARNSGKLMSKVINTPTGQRVRVFVPFDQDDMSNYYAFAREYTAAKSSAFDKVYEYWINWPLLSGPQTQVANITGNAAQVAWHYTGQRLAEATLNLAYRDPTAPQFREFKHVLKGFWQGIGPAYDMARQTFLTEGDTIRHKYLGEPMEIDVVNGDLDKVGNIRASVGGKLGRINRLPGRVLRFTDAFFKTAIMYAEASAVAYRRAHVAAKAQGLTGKARSTFIDTEIANTINDTSSAVWGEVMKTAEELLFQDENMATEIVDTVLGGYKGIRDLEQKLAEAEAKGDYEQAAKLQKRIRSRKIVGSLMRWIFPFQRTPTNIVRVGIKKAGGSAISLLYGLTAAGWQSMGKNGVPMIKSYPKAMQIKDASETLLAGLGWLALASMLEGDDDDDKKKVLLVGTRSHSLKDRGATDQFLRKYGGENSIVWQDGNGKVLGTLPFGRYEPAATLLTTWIDAYRNYQEVKRLKSQGENALYTTYMMSSLVSSLEDKSFLQGFANAMQFVRDVEEKRESPDENAGSKMLMNNIIPNLIKQPLRNMDDVLRERTTAGPGYAALPNPAVAPKLPIFAAQPKISTTGERLTKAFTPPARLLFQANTKVTPQADALLYRANRLNPTKRWSPQPLNRDDYTADPPGKAKPLPITDPAKRRQFAELAGRLYAAKAAQVAAKAMPSEKSKPTPSIITAFKKAREDAMAAARAQAHAMGLHKPTSTP